MQRQGVEDRCEHVVDMRHADDEGALSVLDAGLAIGKDNQLTAAGAHFLQVGLELF